MRYYRSWSSLLLCFLEYFTYVHGWGPVGHSVIIRLAQSQLTDTAADWIRSLTPWHWNGNLSALGSWADDILYPDTNPTGYENWQWSRPLHYINTPDWSCDYQEQRDCIKDVCVAGAIKNYTKRLESEFDEVQLKEALYFLIHYVADIHQPLHTGFISDRGGNSVQGRYMNGSFVTNLHSLWDQGLLSTRLARDFQRNTSLYYEHISDLMQNQSCIDQDNEISQWIAENIHYVCTEIYFDQSNAVMNASMNFTLDERYYEKSIPIIEQRLARGGRRLGTLLNQIVKNRAAKPPGRKERLCAGTIALIVILSVEAVLAVAIGLICYYRSRVKSFSLSPVFY